MYGDWTIQSSILKKLFPELTDKDLKFEAGKKDELLSKLESRLKKTKGEIITLIKKGQPEFNSDQKNTINNF